MSALGRKNNRTATVRLWKIDQHCYWCGVETVLAQKGETRKDDNTATFDHWYSVLDEERWEGNNHNLGVLACRKCNGKRGTERLAQYRAEQDKNRLSIRQQFELTYYGKVITQK